MKNSEKYLLKVYGTLKKGRINHWMLGKTPVDKYLNGYEYYKVTNKRLFFLDVFEFLCGYNRIEEENCFVYRKRRFWNENRQRTA